MITLHSYIDQKEKKKKKWKLNRRAIDEKERIIMEEIGEENGRFRTAIS